MVAKKYEIQSFSSNNKMKRTLEIKKDFQHGNRSAINYYFAESRTHPGERISNRLLCVRLSASFVSERGIFVLLTLSGIRLIGSLLNPTAPSARSP